MIDVERLRAYRAGLDRDRANLFDVWPVAPGREELCDALDEIGDLCGMPSEAEWVADHRDW